MTDPQESTPLGETAERLLEAALEAFNTDGFGGTDSNKIARRAGYAPQTFYRWFPDKTAIFIAAYERWEREEMAVIETLLKQGPDRAAAAVTAAIVAHHREYRVFRRSLRALAVEHPAVRAARTASRRRQIARIREWTGVRSPAAIALTLLQVERLCDALADEELLDLGVAAPAAEAAITALLQGLQRDPG